MSMVNGNSNGNSIGSKHSSYHSPPVKGPTGSDVHILQCLSSRIHLGYHLDQHISSTISQSFPNTSTIVIITDSNLESLHLPQLVSSLNQALSKDEDRVKKNLKTRILIKIIKPGEESKSRKVKEEVEDWMLEMKCVRDTILIALGGGVVGDLSGFIASTFMRGIPVIHIPTTLLAMVDSSVGGKTAIDTPHGKNLIGAFHQPRFIFIDAALLETLPEREFSNGMAEVVKTAAIWDSEDFSKLESSSVDIRSAVLSGRSTIVNGEPTGRTLATRTKSQTLLLDVIRGSVGVKAEIVNIDEKETGLRNLVNFGHSIGHAIEAVLTPDMLHGECVSIGMILESELSRSVFGLSQVTISRLVRCLKAYDLPVSINDPRVKAIQQKRKVDLSAENLLDIMKVDKKNQGDKKKVVLLERIGKTWEEMASTVPDSIIRRVLCDSIKIPMNVSIKAEEASSTKDSRLSVPGSKSVSNRALVLASLSSGTTRLRGLLHSDDTAVMMEGLKKLNASTFEWEDSGNTVVVHGSGGKLSPLKDGKDEIYLQNAGTAARFMTSVVSLVGEKTIITGNKRMKERPIGDLVDALRANGVEIDYKESKGCLPLEIKGAKPTEDGTLPGLKGGQIELSAKISSQYVSSILLCSPYAQEEVTLNLIGGEVISQLYIDMTISMMKDFGIVVERLRGQDGTLLNSYRIPQGTYQPPPPLASNGSDKSYYDVEGDASSATYPLALAALRGTSTTITNIGSSSLQGDARFARDVLGKMGCDVKQSEKETTVVGHKIGGLRQIGLVDMEPMTDAFLTASVLLAAAPLPSTDGNKSSTRITGIANQRVKECNRIKAMMDELKKLGVETLEHEDGLEIFGKDPKDLIQSLEREDRTIHCYDDHRVGMAFSCLGAGLSHISSRANGSNGTATAITSSSGMILDEKRCVEKTWPSWWDDLSRSMGISITGLDLPSSTSSTSTSSAATSSTSRRYSPNATIFCIGMRASGKTYLGGFGAAALRRPFLDADVVFNERIGLNGFVAKHGWPAFRAKELEFLQEFMNDYSEGHLISLGGGVVETPECRELLKNYAQNKGPVVYVKRDIDEVVKFLETSDRPSYGEPVRDVFKRREPFFRECSSAELVSYGGGKKEKKEAFDADLPPNEANVSSQGMSKAASDSLTSGSAVSSLKMEDSSSIRKTYGLEAEVSRFFRFISGIDTNQVSDLYQSEGKGRRTYFLCLTFPDITPALEHLETLSVGVDAIEFRVDLLNPSGKAIKQGERNVPSPEYVEAQLASLRQCTSLPIIFTVRTVSQGGSFPDDDEEAYFTLLKLGLRHGCEYLDLEIKFDDEKLKAIRNQRGHSSILASWHDWSGNLQWESKEVKVKFDQMKKRGDIVKIVGKANSLNDNVSLENFRKSVSNQQVPFLGINMGSKGQLSRILNPVLSPVSHDNLPSKAAPGQLTIVEIHKARNLIGLLDKRKFYLFGTPIKQSLSPTLHNEAFYQLGMPHHYNLCEKAEVDDELKSLIRSDEFGGGSVTIPLKLEVIPLLDSLTPDAKAIGAVNTIIPIRAPNSPLKLMGDNTDWIAITALCQRNLSPVQLSSPEFSALVIGAGGSARAAIYAMHKLGARKIMLFNRTIENAEKLRDQVPKEWNVVVEKDLENLSSLPSAVVSNVPADGTSLKKEDGKGVTIPREILMNPQGGVAIDMSYKPFRTPLLSLVEEVNSSGVIPSNANLSSSFTSNPAPPSKDRHNLRQGRLWTGVPGLTILLEQGCHQFVRWTGVNAPREAVEKKCWERYASQQ